VAAGTWAAGTGAQAGLTRLLAECTVRLGGQDARGGTGFFVAPGRVVTCAHVVEGRVGDQVEVFWGDQETTGRVVAQHPPARPAGGGTYPFPDLAVVAVGEWPGHSCVWLDQTVPELEARLHTRGFTQTFRAAQPTAEPATFTCDGLHEVEGGQLLKFSAGEAVPGMSGGPLLDLGTGRVCGIVKTSRDPADPRGGWAIPARVLWQLHPELQAAHDRLHAQDVRWRSLAEGWAELAELLLELPPLRSDQQVPSALLRPEFEVVAFSGREAVLDQLEGWCVEPGAFAVRLITAPGGQGKSRLARQLCARMTALGWLAGPLQRADLSEVAVRRLQTTSVAVLLVVDYAETRTDQLARLVDGLAGRQRAGPVRLLLLARAAGDWWAEFRRATPRRGSILDGVVEIELTALHDTPDGRQQTYQDAMVAFTRHRGHAPPSQSMPDLTDPKYGVVLNVHLAALAAVLEAEQPSQSVRSSDPVARVLDHEQRYWYDAARAAGLAQTYEQVDLDRAVAAATLCGADDETQAVALLRRIPNLSDTAQVVRLARLIRRLYPSRTGYWGPLQPDLLGEELVAAVTADPVVPGGPAGVPIALLIEASEQQVARALTVLARAAPRHAHLREALAPLLQSNPELLLPAVTVASQARDPRPLTQALQQALDGLEGGALLMQLARRLPWPSLALADLAVAATERALDYHRAQTDASDLAATAELLNNLSNRLSAVGRREAALVAIEEAVTICRELARAAPPDAFLPDLAMSLNNLANHLSDLGRREAALVAIEEAVTIRRDLAQAAPDAFLPDLATALNNLAIRLSAVGRREAALAAAEEAVTIRRELVAAAPDAFLPDLAASLRSLTAILRSLGRQEEAQQVQTEVKDLFPQEED
jgi:tetratricopeptide (TPR) repeat protein